MKSLRIAIGLVVLASAAFLFAQWNLQNGVTFRTYKSGNYSQMDTYGNWVIINQGDFEQLWPKISGERASSAPRDVKWNEERLVAITLGQRTSGGYSIFVKSIERRGANLVVTYVERQPPAGSVNTSVITSPWVIIRMPKIAGNYVFSKETIRGPSIPINENPRKGCCKGRCGCTCCADH